MKTIYLWEKDFQEHQYEIMRQLAYELKDLKIKIVLTYEEDYVWEMGNK